jgi:hypothetical protein
MGSLSTKTGGKPETKSKRSLLFHKKSAEDAKYVRTRKPVRKGDVLVNLGESSYHNLVTRLNPAFRVEWLPQDVLPNTEIMYVDTNTPDKKRIVLVAKYDLHEHTRLTLDHKFIPWTLSSLA